jgi:hypothetical protein
MDYEPFDPSLYTRAPILTIATGIALSHALVSACPDIMPDAVKKSAKHLHKVSKKAQDAWAERLRLDASVADVDTRALDVETDASWSALRARLLAYADLPAARFPKARRAAEIVDGLFGAEGLGFLRDAYPVQWSTMDTLLQRIDDEGTAADIDALAGPEFLKNIRHIHPRYGKMVKAIFQADASGPNLIEQVRALQRAIVSYATKVCATVEDDDAKTAAAAALALAPIDQLRQQSAARKSGGAKEEDGQDAAAPEEEKKDDDGDK